MTWLSAPESAGHLGEAVSHFNEALDWLERDGTESEATRCLSDALGEIQTAWSLSGDRKPTGGVEAFLAMLTQELSPDARTELVGSDEALDLRGLDQGSRARTMGRGCFCSSDWRCSSPSPALKECLVASRATRRSAGQSSLSSFSW